MQRFNIKGQQITVAKCLTCGHEVDITSMLLQRYEINGIKYFSVLLALDATAFCCEKPNYLLDELWFKR